MKKIVIRAMQTQDIPEIVLAFDNISWHKSATLFESYLRDQANGERFVWVVHIDEQFAGYVTLKLHSNYLAFQEQNIPEINDLNVLPEFRNKGIGGQLLKTAENKAREMHHEVGIGVGLSSDYGAAQRLYVKRGYIPDGKGATYQEKPVIPWQNYCVDDDFNLWFTKKLTP